jgi:hypothetical protein
MMCIRGCLHHFREVKNTIDAEHPVFYRQSPNYHPKNMNQNYPT